MCISMENLGHITTVILAAIASVAIVLLICVVRAYMNSIMDDKTDE